MTSLGFWAANKDSIAAHPERSDHQDARVIGRLIDDDPLTSIGQQSCDEMCRNI